jgi:hypothetical protein
MPQAPLHPAHDHAHDHGSAHGHAYPSHHHSAEDGVIVGAQAKPHRPPLSLIRLSVAARLCVAGALAGVIWLAVLLALA